MCLLYGIIGVGNSGNREGESRGRKFLNAGFLQLILDGGVVDVFSQKRLPQGPGGMLVKNLKQMAEEDGAHSFSLAAGLVYKPSPSPLLPRWLLLNSSLTLVPTQRGEPSHPPLPVFSFRLSLLAAPAELEHTHRDYFLAGVSHIEEEGHCSPRSHILEALPNLLATIMDDISKQGDGTFPNCRPFLGGETGLLLRHAMGQASPLPLFT